MKRSVTVTVHARTPQGVRLTLSKHSNERTGETLEDLTLTMHDYLFERLAADHGLTPADFPVGKPVRVSESA